MRREEKYQKKKKKMRDCMWRLNACVINRPRLIKSKQFNIKNIHNTFANFLL